LRTRLTVLIFHRVRAATDPLFPNETTARTFEAQLRWVSDWFNVMPLGAAVDALAGRTLPERPLCITFDDGYADNCTVALPILKRLGLTATFFLASGYLNGGRMWNDTVIEAVRRSAAVLDLEAAGLGSHALDSIEARRGAIDSLLGKLKYLPAKERAERAALIADRSGAALPEGMMLTHDQVRDLVEAGMEIGAHTVTHPILANLPDDEARDEIVEGRRQLESIAGAPVSLFAYPNGKPGRDYTAAHVAIVRDAGFKAACSTAWGAASPGCDLHQIPRFTPWDRSAWRYALRLGQVGRRATYALA
jgi:peptidoglycan/xylan/chitin deacetylase (PgdA/CDA1 family)